jgi:hypothetical protein
MPKISPLSPETLAWLHQAAAAGVAEPIVLRHALERLEALEAVQQQSADHLRGAAEMASTPEAAPVATDQELLAIRSWLSHRPALDSDLGEPGRQHGAGQPPAQPPAAPPVPTDEQLLSMRSWSSHGPTFDSDLVEFGRRCHNLNREPSAAQPPGAQPTPEGALVAAEQGLVRCYAKAVEDTLKAGISIENAADAGLRAVYSLGCQHGPAKLSAQPACVVRGSDAVITAELEKMVELEKAAEAKPLDPLPARVLAMCKKRGWSLHWSSRGAYLHLEASELIEAIRGKRGDPLAEAADVLIVLMSITENAGIPWGDVLNQTAATCARLEVCDPYLGEERDAHPPAAQPAPLITPYGKTAEQARRDRAAEAGKAAADASFEAVLAAQPTPPPPNGAQIA